MLRSTARFRRCGVGRWRCLSTRLVDYSNESEKILDTPLGRFSRSSIDTTIEIIGYWCSQQSIHTLSRAEKLLQRLKSERASGNIHAKDKSWAVPQLQEMLLRSWLQVDQKVGAERANMALEAIVSNYVSGRDISIKPRDDMFVDVVEKWLQVHGDVGAIQAANFTLTLLADHPDLVTNRGIVSDCFQRLSETLSSIDHDESLGALMQLLRRMEKLRSDGWDNMDPTEAVAEKAAKGDSSSTSANIDMIASKQYSAAHNENDAFLVESINKQFEDAAQAGDSRTAEKVESMFQRLRSSGDDKETGFALGVDTYLLMIYFYRRADPKGAAVKAAQLLQELVQQILAGKVNGDIPATVFDHVLDLLLKSDAIHEGNTVRSIAYCLKELWLSDRIEFHPSARSLCHVLLVQAPGCNMSGVTDELFSFLRDRHDIVHRPILMEALTDAAKLLASKGMAKEVKGLIESAIKSGFELDSCVFEGALSGHILAGHGQSAAQMLEKLEGMCKDGKHTETNLLSYREQVILCLARSSRSVVGIRRCKMMYKDLCQRFLDDSEDISSDFVTELSENLLEALKYSGRLNEAEELLLQMESNLKSSQGKFPLSTVCFNHVMIARKTDLGKVRSIFNRMLDYKKAGFTCVSPTSTTFGIYLRTLSKRENSGTVEEAMDTIQSLIALSETDESVRLDSGHFNAVLLLLKDDGDDDALTKACDLIYRMLDLDVQTEAFTFTTILQAHMKFTGGDGEASSRRAERLLDRMVAEYELGGGEDTRPEAIAFNSVVGALGRSGRADAAPSALALLDTMQRLDVEPNAYTYNMVLDACARTGERHGDEKAKRGALEVAIDTMVRMRADDSNVSPDEVTYGTLLKAYRHLLPRGNDRNMLARQAFQMCCADGLVSDALLRNFQSLLADQARRSFQKGLSPDGKVPEAWTRNLYNKL